MHFLRLLSFCLLAALMRVEPSVAQTPIPSSNLRVWFNGDAGIVVNGGNNTTVTDWHDQSGNNLTVSQPYNNVPAQPTYIPNAVNGHGARRFNGTTNFLETATANDVLAGADDVTAFLVVVPGTSQNASASIIDHEINSAPLDGFSLAQSGSLANQYAFT